MERVERAPSAGSPDLPPIFAAVRRLRPHGSAVQVRLWYMLGIHPRGVHRRIRRALLLLRAVYTGPRCGRCRRDRLRQRAARLQWPRERVRILEQRGIGGNREVPDIELELR